MSLLLSLRFPTGRYAAAAWDDRDRPEWPPHPARLALAFVDVLHKAGNPDHLRMALDWLCELPAPEIVTPASDRIDIQRMDGYYVPQNPTQAKSVKHPRKARAFPTVLLDSEHPAIFFHWPDASPEDPVMEALCDLGSRLPRFGHSSSLVAASFSLDVPPNGDEWHRLVSCDENPLGHHRIRVPYPGLREAAEKAYDAAGRAKEMSAMIKKAAKSKTTDKMLNPPASPRGRHDPRHQWQDYAEPSPPEADCTVWDQRVLILARVGGTRMGLSSIWQVADAFHKALLDRWSRDGARGPVPEWISGHQSGEGHTPALDSNHLAIFPLADVGHDHHAKGHLMGIGLASPSPDTAGVDPMTLRIEWRKVMSALFPDGTPLELSPSDNTWKMLLQPADPTEQRRALKTTRWTRPATHWVSVTPVILDRHPKPHFQKNPEAWAESCRSIIRKACQRIGLPDPVEIQVSPYSTVQGAPPAPQFTPPSPRPGRPARYHIHTSLVFDRQISGPVLLGAGRFRGYGLLMPRT